MSPGPLVSDPRKLCENCGLLYNWTPGGKKILFRSGSPIRFSTLDPQNGQQQVVLSHPKYDIHGVEYAPDEIEGIGVLRNPVA